MDSINFAGQTHRWRLSGLLQRGRDRRRDALLTDLALATRFLVVTAKARLVSHCFSVSQSFKALLTGLLRLLGEQFASSARLYVTSEHRTSALPTLHYIYMCRGTYVACYIYMHLADIIIGVPSLQAHNLDAKIREERCRYLVAELVCRVRHCFRYLPRDTISIA